MKFSPDTIALLKNFSTINPMILIEKGSTIATRTVLGSIYAYAEVPEDFKDPMAIHDLPQFLNVFTMFKDPSLDLTNGRQALIRDGKTTVNYTFSEPSLMKPVPKNVNLPSTVTEFELPAAQLQQILRAADVMTLPEIYVRGDGHSLTMGATDSQTPSSNSFNVDIGETKATFTALIRRENFKHLSRDYRVTITPQFSKFESIDNAAIKVTYYVAFEERSKF